jgi:hypothetical protein
MYTAVFRHRSWCAVKLPVQGRARAHPARSEAPAELASQNMLRSQQAFAYGDASTVHLVAEYSDVRQNPPLQVSPVSRKVATTPSCPPAPRQFQPSCPAVYAGIATANHVFRGKLTEAKGRRVHTWEIRGNSLHPAQHGPLRRRSPSPRLDCTLTGETTVHKSAARQRWERAPCIWGRGECAPG